MILLPLNSQHDRKGFDCGNDDLNGWFSQVARQHKDRGVSPTFVAATDYTRQKFSDTNEVSHR